MTRQSYIFLFFVGTVVYVVLFVAVWTTFSIVTSNNKQLLSVRNNTRAKIEPNNETLKLTFRDAQQECLFPILDPFNPAVMKWIYKYDTVDCTHNTSKPSLVFLYRDIWLVVNKAKAKRLGIKFESCQYTQLKMVEGSDYHIQPYQWSDRFDEIIHLKSDDEFLYSRCYYRGRIVARSFISRFIKKPKIEERVNVDYQLHLKSHTPLETLNILMIGLDGMSKQAFERSMPKTRNFLLHELRAKELHKHNKVGLNTFPNNIPLLTGKHLEELLQEWSYDEKFDKIDHFFIWDEYKKAGYRTAFMTDVVWLTMFHYAKKGWHKPPFDYFFRPIPAKVFPEKRDGKMKEDCIGDTPEVTLCLNYWLQLTSTLNKTIHHRHHRPATPYFAYSFFTRLSHDFASLSNKGDELYLSFFQEIKRRNTLHNTVMLVFSDHGGRFGKVREMHQGMLESRMPFFMFVFPPWFQEKYPKVMATFKANQNRLTTNFDVHATLQDLMNFSGHIKVLDSSNEKQRGISLFREIPKYRNCKDAGIPIKYCSCSHIHNTSISDTTRTIVVFTLFQHITSATAKRGDICEQLRLKSIVSVLPVDPERSEEEHLFYQITIETVPGGAKYEATVSYDSGTFEGKVVGDVVRLNMYKGQDECMSDLQLKPYCYCRKR